VIGLDTNVLVGYLTQDDPVRARRANAVVAAALEKGERCRLDATFDRRLKSSAVFRVLR
jgi:hypothetical protein